MAPAPIVTPANRKTVVDNLNRVLEEIYAKNKSLARKLYGELASYALTFTGRPHTEAEKNKIRATARPLNNASQWNAIEQFLALPPSTLGANDPRVLEPGARDSLPSLSGIPGVTDVTGFLSALAQRNTWLRVGEGVLGLLLIGIGVAAVTRNTPLGSAIRSGVKATPAGKVTKILS